MPKSKPVKKSVEKKKSANKTSAKPTLAKQASRAKPVAPGKAKFARPVPVETKTVQAKPVPEAKQSGAKPATTRASAPKSVQEAVQKLGAKLTAKSQISAQGPIAPPKAQRKSRSSKAAELSGEKATQLGQKWSTLFRKSQELEAKSYNMRQSYEAKTPIVHKLLGWGYILTNKNDRLEVLFKDGIRYLISNYKA